MAKYTQTTWRAQVEAADPDWLHEKLHPVRYEFSNGRQFRDRPRANPYSVSTNGED